MTTDLREPDGPDGDRSEPSQDQSDHGTGTTASQPPSETSPPPDSTPHSPPPHSPPPHSPIMTPLGVWVAGDDQALPGFGRIMLSRPVSAITDSATLGWFKSGAGPSGLAGILDHTDPRLTQNAGFAARFAANDNVIWVGDDDGTGGVYGRDPSVASLPNGDTMVAWIGLDNIVHAKLYTAELPSGDDDGGPANADINAALEDLGAAGAADVSALNKVKVVANTDKSFATVWTTEFGLTSVIMGKLLMSSAAAGEAAALVYDPASAPHATLDISPTTVAKFTGVFDVIPSDGGKLQITYETEDRGSASEQPGLRDGVILVASDGQATPLIDQLYAEENFTAGDGDDGAAAAARYAATYQPPEHTQAADPRDAVNDDSGPARGDATAADPAPDGSFAVAGDATDTIIQTQPQVVVTASGQVFVLNVVPDSLGSPVARLIIARPSADGSGTGSAPIVVSEFALIKDPGNPSLNVGPTITAAGDRIGVAFVEAGSDGHSSHRELKTQVYDSHGTPTAHEAVVVARSDDPDATFSDLAIGSCGRDDDDHDDGDGSGDGTGDGTGAPLTAANDDASGSPAGSLVQPAGHEGRADSAELVAVAWVQNAGDGGYGVITAQIFEIHDGQDGSARDLTALGHDGRCGGEDNDDDRPFQFSSDDGAVVGRAPQLEGLDDGSLAVAWVQETQTGSGIGVVHGVILNPGSEAPPQSFDLSDMMPAGVMAGTAPNILDTPGGDLVISWLQAAMTGGYEAAAAVFKAAGFGHWLPPAAAIILNHFDELPASFSITASEDRHGETSLTMVWRDGDNDIVGARYDMDGEQQGQQFDVYGSSGHGSGSGQGSGLDDGASLSIATLPDGQIFVAYSETSGTDSDIRALVLPVLPVADASVSDHSGSDNSGPGPDDATCDGDGGPASNGSFVAVDIDLQSDTIRIVTGDSSGLQDAVALAPAAATVATAACDAPTVDDLALTLAAYPATDVSSHRGRGSSTADTDSCETGNSGPAASDDGLLAGDLSAADGADSPDGDGSGHNGGRSGIDLADLENMNFKRGFGNEVDDFIVPEDYDNDQPQPIDGLFEALQFANALSEAVHHDVLTFDDANVVTLKNFETLLSTQPAFDLT